MIKKSNAYIIAVIAKDDNDEYIYDECDELTLLSSNLDYSIIDIIYQKKSFIDPATYVGKGKLKNIINKANILNVKTLIFNNELKPSHFNHINKLTKNKIKIIDRTKIILDIFSKHAKTIESKKQIQLASLQYLLPRLKGMWTHLERQMGGIGTRGGPGEKQIEIDRRIAGKQITKLKKELKNIEKSRSNMRKNRDSIFKICLAGYTNAGKSTLMRELSGHDVYVENKLFATLETTTKKITTKSNHKYLLSDTVGFLNNLPHNLIASFRSTLEEMNEADLIIQLIDISTSNINRHINTINETLKIIGVKNTKKILVFNKIDKIKSNNIFKTINKKYPDSITISAENKLKINTLENEIIRYIEKDMITRTLSIPYDLYEIINYIYKNTIVLNENVEENKVKIKFKTTKKNYDAIKSEL